MRAYAYTRVHVHARTHMGVQVGTDGLSSVFF